MESMLNFGKGTAFRLSELLRVNCEAELRVTYYLTGGIQNLLRQKPCEGAKTDSRAEFGKETIVGAHRRPKWVPHYGAQADSGACSGYSGSAQALLRLVQACSPSAQVKAAVAQVRRLKRNQRKGKLILSLWEFDGSKQKRKKLTMMDQKFVLLIQLDCKGSKWISRYRCCSVFGAAKQRDRQCSSIWGKRTVG